MAKSDQQIGRKVHFRSVDLHNVETLKQLVAEARESGEPVDGETALKHLRAKYVAMRVTQDR